MRNDRTNLIVVALAVLAVASVLGGGCAPKPVAVEPIRIGFHSSLTGPLAVSGADNLAGAKLALKEINEAGGVLGRPLQLVIEDDKCVPAEGVTAATKLITRDNVPVVIAGPCSSVVLAVMGVFESEGVPGITGVASHVGITAKAGVGGNKWMFRVNPTAGMYAVVGARILVQDAGLKTFYTLADESDFGRGGAEEWGKEIEASGGKILGADFYPFGQPDFVPILTKIKASGADALLWFGNVEDTLTCAKGHLELGMKMPFVGRITFTEEMMAEIGDALEGAWNVHPWFPEDDAPESLRFVEAFKAEYGRPPLWQALQYYVTAQVVADAIKRAGSVDSTAIRDALETTKLETALGLIEFDDHNQAHQEISAAQIQGGKTVVVFKGH